MKSIYFSNYTKAYHIIFPIGGVTILIALNFIHTIPFQQLYWYKVAAFGIIILYFAKIALENLLLKNFVRWTSGMLFIKIGTRKSTTIKFEKITGHQFHDGILTIRTFEENFTFDLKNYKSQSVQRLLKIIKTYA